MVIINSSLNIRGLLLGSVNEEYVPFTEAVYNNLGKQEILSSEDAQHVMAGVVH
ncbi:MAG: hypothetical protein ACP5NY_01060 [Thermocladium sp.]